MAKDLRLFVQSSNMSRQQQQQQQQQPALASSTSPYKTQKKRRTDWTEYLDPKDDQGTNLKQEEDEEGVGFEHEIVTEFPAELSKKRKLNKYGCWSDTRKGDADELHNHKSVFSKRNFNKHIVSPAADGEDAACVSYISCRIKLDYCSPLDNLSDMFWQHYHMYLHCPAAAGAGIPGSNLPCFTEKW